MLSSQSFMPAGAGTPGYENETWSLELFGCGWCHPSPLDSGFRRNDVWGTGLTIGGQDRTDECGGGGIQALSRLRSIIFVPIAHAGWRRHTEV